MPQVLIEYTASLKTVVDWAALLRRLHPVLARSASTPEANCKSRVVCHDNFQVGEEKVCFLKNEHFCMPKLSEIMYRLASNCRRTSLIQGAESRAFVHFSIGILPGRTSEVKQLIGNSVLEVCVSLVNRFRFRLSELILNWLDGSSLRSWSLTYGQRKRLKMSR